MRSEITLWSSRAPEHALPKIRSKKTPIIEQVNFFTMVPSVEFIIASGNYNGRRAHAEELKTRTLLTFVVTLGRCTTDAKAVRAKSSTYGAKFDLPCKTLQQSVPHSRHNSGRDGGLEWGSILRKPMTINDKQQVTRHVETCRGGPLMAHQFYSLLVRRA